MRKHIILISSISFAIIINYLEVIDASSNISSRSSRHHGNFMRHRRGRLIPNNNDGVWKKSYNKNGSCISADNHDHCLLRRAKVINTTTNIVSSSASTMLDGGRIKNHDGVDNDDDDDDDDKGTITATTTTGNTGSRRRWMRPHSLSTSTFPSSSTTTNRAIFINRIMTNVSSKARLLTATSSSSSFSSSLTKPNLLPILSSSMRYCLSGIRSNVSESNKHYIDLPFTGRGGGGAIQQVNAIKSKKRDTNTTKSRRNNTGAYYGIQDDVFFKQTQIDEQEDTTAASNGYKSKESNTNDTNPISELPSFFSQQSFNDDDHDTIKQSKSSSSTLGEIMGQTLLELREMREDVMALREEMHYMKEEMRRNYSYKGNLLPTNDDDDDDDNDNDNLSMNQNNIRRQQFELISKDIEKWAHRLLFEENTEGSGWKEVSCNKMVRKKYNKDGSTKCFVKWMKDSRNNNIPNSDEEDNNVEYPCIKCYATLNAPIEIVCDYLSQESNMSQYNDLVVAYRDIEDISPQSKICHSQCPQILFIKPRDFVTFCHHRWRKDGTQIIVNQACEHKDAPGNDEECEGKICRAHALRGANFISRDPDDPFKTRIAILAHANPGGEIPQWAMKTAFNAVAPIEPFKLFHNINERVSVIEELSTNPTSIEKIAGNNHRPAGISQLGYACFWP